MKKEFLKGVTMLLGIVALAFVTAVASNAQSANKFAVDIPFEFSVDYKTMPAGAYVVETVASASHALLIQSADGKTSVLRPSEAIERTQTAATARLVFHRYGERYFLAEVWSDGEKSGRQLKKSVDELAIEREVAEINSKSETAKHSYEKVEVTATRNLAKLR